MPDDLINFVKKKGFRDTYEVLTKFKNHKTDKKTFYTELNKFSYYNSFFRVKDEMIDKGLITMGRQKNNDRIYIALTKKGLDVYKKLLEINELIKN